MSFADAAAASCDFASSLPLTHTRRIGWVLFPPSGSLAARFEQHISSVIIGTVRITPPPERHADVLEVLRSVQGRIQDQSGCIDCHVYEEEGPEPAIVLVERWRTEESLEVHLRSNLYMRVLESIEFSGAPPDIRFDHVSASEGIERIERSRSRTRV